MFDVDGPIYLPNGQCACFAHHQPVCHICCCDYAHMDGYDSDFGYDPELREGTGSVFPEKYRLPSPSATPQTLFPARPGNTRFYHVADRSQALVYTDGSCLSNGRRDPRAGCAFVYKPSNAQNGRGYINFPLEKEGPFGDEYPVATNNRAELRAVIAALRYLSWDTEEISTVVIACDSTYVVDGATEWSRQWVRNGWTTASRGAEPLEVANQDLWECLLGEVERWAERGVAIRFWRIPRELNTEADRWAKEAAKEEGEDRFWDYFGGREAYD